MPAPARKSDYVQAFTDTLGLIREYFPEYMPGDSVMCPFHDDTKGSLHIEEDGKSYCHGCGQKASGIVGFYSMMEAITFAEACEILYNELEHPIPPAKVDKMEGALLSDIPEREDARSYLWNDRNIPIGIQMKFRLGFDPASHRITIPVINQWGDCVNIRRFRWKDGDEEKVINIRGRGEVRLFPENEIWKEQKLVLCEGEFDALVLRAYGIPGVSWTGGCRSWNHRFDMFFENKLVWVIYDDDEPGREAQGDAVKHLNAAGAFVFPLPPPKARGKDITDWSFSCPKWLQHVKDSVDHTPVPETRTRKICPTCGQRIQQ